jgi:hypothetical protein
MRRVVVWLGGILLLGSTLVGATLLGSTTPGFAAAPAGSSLTETGTALRPGELASENGVLRWMNGYRVHHDYGHVVDAIKALSALGSFKDPGASGVYVGFLAGVLGSNPKRADELITKLLALPHEDQWVIVQAVAYSGLPNWKDLLRHYSARMPTRSVMIDKYLNGKLKTLDDMEFAKPKKNMWQEFTGYLDITKHLPGAEHPREYDTEDASTTVLDTLWGYYFATGSAKPILRLISVLPWSKDRNSVDRLTVGSTAKLTLASNAVRDGVLLGILKSEAKQQPKETAVILDDVVDAAETAQTERIRKDALADIDEIRRKGSGSKRDTVWWGQAGEVVIAGVCVVGAALGNVAFGLPCVIGGSVTAAGLQYYSNSNQ